MLFLIAGEAKLLSVFGDAKILKWPDPVLRLPGAFDGRRRHRGSGWIAVRVGEGLSFSGAVVAVVGGRFDFVSGDGLDFIRRRTCVRILAGC